MFRASQENLPEPSCDEPKREGLGPIHKTRPYEGLLHLPCYRSRT
jgi:hypothetical protein